MDLTVKQNVGWNSTLAISYPGSLGRELPSFVDTNIDTVNISAVSPQKDPASTAPTARLTYNPAVGTPTASNSNNVYSPRQL